MNTAPSLSTSWIILPGGDLAILRAPAETVPANSRIATPQELFAANQGAPYPWGYLPDSSRASTLWKEHRIGYGGLLHSAWFLTTSGRFGGAPNVAETGPDALRYCMLLHGGESELGTPLENEGYAVIRAIDEEDQLRYRTIQQRAARHVMADGGAIILTQRDADDISHVGFVGRCMRCPNAEEVSWKALLAAVPEIPLALLPEWKNWRA